MLEEQENKIVKELKDMLEEMAGSDISVSVRSLCKVFYLHDELRTSKIDGFELAFTEIPYDVLREEFKCFNGEPDYFIKETIFIYRIWAVQIMDELIKERENGRASMGKPHSTNA